jgi:DNA-directed RNA polymerase sigma subunit (sigma70/sigma32)
MSSHSKSGFKIKKVKASGRDYGKDQCIICRRQFVKKRFNATTCGSKECKAERRKRTDKRIRQVAFGSNTQNGYYDRFPTPKCVEDFEYVKLYNKALRTVVVEERSSQKALHVQATKQLREFINSLDPRDDYRKLLELELAYMREVEKERLRRNIKAVLGEPSVGGEYTLADTGKVLGISRERTRQLEDIVRRYMKRPDSGRLLRDYLTYDVEGGDDRYDAISY